MRLSYYGNYGFPGMGCYAQPPELGCYAEPDPYGAYDPGYGQYDPIGYYADETPLGCGEGCSMAGPCGGCCLGCCGEDPYAYGEDPYAYGEVPFAMGEDPYGAGEFEPIGCCGAMPEMVGYGQYEPFAEEVPGFTDYSEEDFAGYVRDLPPSFNAGCPMPTNVPGVGEAEPLEGYVRPSEVSPTVEQFKPQPGSAVPVPDSFRPLW